MFFFGVTACNNSLLVPDVLLLVQSHICSFSTSIMAAARGFIYRLTANVQTTMCSSWRSNHLHKQYYIYTVDIYYLHGGWRLCVSSRCYKVLCASTSDAANMFAVVSLQISTSVLDIHRDQTCSLCFNDSFPVHISSTCSVLHSTPAAGLWKCVRKKKNP